MFAERFGTEAETEIDIRLELARTGIPATLAAIKSDAEAELLTRDDAPSCPVMTLL